jgi:glutamyl-tRNA reductase
VPPDLIKPHLYVEHDTDAASHIFKVAAGAISMVLGETEIMGQIKQALDCARDAGTAGRVLSRMGDRALAVGKRARTETLVDRGRMSVASVAGDLARQIFDDLSRRRILVLGAGETGELVARRLKDHGARNIVTASRTYERAESLAQALGAEAIAFDDFVGELGHADIVISCTSSPHPLITADRFRQATAGVPRHPVLFIDLAVPRDVEPKVRALDDVYLYDLDDLQKVAHNAQAQRMGEVPKVEAIAEEEAREFMVWAKSQDIVPMMLAIRDKAEGIRDDEMNVLLQARDQLSSRDQKAIHLMTKRMVSRILREPLEQLREIACSPEGSNNLDVVMQLFGIEACDLTSGDDDDSEEAEGSG